jgi:hypothetical protein
VCYGIWNRHTSGALLTCLCVSTSKITTRLLQCPHTRIYFKRSYWNCCTTCYKSICWKTAKNFHFQLFPNTFILQTLDIRKVWKYWIVLLVYCCYSLSTKEGVKIDLVLIIGTFGKPPVSISRNKAKTETETFLLVRWGVSKGRNWHTYVVWFVSYRGCGSTLWHVFYAHGFHERSYSRNVGTHTVALRFEPDTLHSSASVTAIVKCDHRGHMRLSLILMIDRLVCYWGHVCNLFGPHNI